MTEKVRRPVSVIITQIILLILGLLWGILTVFNFFGILNSGFTGVQIMLSVAFSFVILVFSAVFLMGFWGLVKRKAYGRWIGVGGLTLILISSFIGNFVRPSGPLEYYEYKNSAELAGGILASIIIYGLMILLIYRLAKGEPANAFFESPSVNSEPPPPPSFESVE